MHLDDAFGRRDGPASSSSITTSRPARSPRRATPARAAASASPCVTTGPGGTNAITGVLGQWHDSVPALYVSGQVRRDTTVASTAPAAAAARRPGGGHRPPRLADHQVRGLDHRPCDRALPLREGRPGSPRTAGRARCGSTSRWTCRRRRSTRRRWPASTRASSTVGRTARRRRLDRASTWRRRRTAPVAAGRSRPPGARGASRARSIARRRARRPPRRCAGCSTAERPVILAGSAIRSAGALRRVPRVVDALGVPVCTAWNAARRCCWDDHPLFVGRPGSHRRPRRQLRAAERRRRAGPRLPAQRPPGRLRVRGVRPPRVPHRRRHRRGRAGQADHLPATWPSTPTSASSSRSWSGSPATELRRVRTTAGSRGAASGGAATRSCCREYRDRAAPVNPYVVRRRAVRAARARATSSSARTARPASSPSRRSRSSAASACSSTRVRPGWATTCRPPSAPPSRVGEARGPPVAGASSASPATAASR